MANNKKNLTFSSNQKYFYKKRQNLYLKKYIFTSYGVNKFNSYKDNILQNNTISSIYVQRYRGIPLPLLLLYLAESHTA